MIFKFLSSCHNDWSQTYELGRWWHVTIIFTINKKLPFCFRKCPCSFMERVNHFRRFKGGLGRGVVLVNGCRGATLNDRFLSTNLLVYIHSHRGRNCGWTAGTCPPRFAINKEVPFYLELGSKSARFARALTFLAPAECFIWLPYSFSDHHLNSA